MEQRSVRKRNKELLWSLKEQKCIVRVDISSSWQLLRGCGRQMRLENVVNAVWAIPLSSAGRVNIWSAAKIESVEGLEGYASMVLDTQNQLSALDQHVAPGLRLWMLIALVSGVLLIMVVLVCCFMRIRIPRTKRQIDLIAAKRKMRNKSAKTVHADERAQAIVMNSMRPKSSTAAKPTISEQPADEQPLVHKGSRQHTEV
ncbi:hypothetical protein ANCCAN_10203 [Ancylostoma caninum]|uniref:Uncharacterized protein n=2 Tax=Ancylostoma caninum TaxID=29170 RepID=A0A368GHF8_ANCCA|nr:hypothetical protein ANCCAN_10203 [Ancylostoma caninum]